MLFFLTCTKLVFTSVGNCRTNLYGPHIPRTFCGLLPILKNNERWSREEVFLIQHYVHNISIYKKSVNILKKKKSNYIEKTNGRPSLDIIDRDVDRKKRRFHTNRCKKKKECFVLSFRYVERN